MGYSRKLKRGSISESAIKLQASEEALYMVLAACVDILWNDWGKIHKKKNRLKNFMDLYRVKLEAINEEPTGKQLEAEKEFYAQTGCTISRK